MKNILQNKNPAGIYQPDFVVIEVDLLLSCRDLPLRH